jgi:hypothetical protein
VLRFLLDEHLRGPLWLAILRHNARSELPIDVVRVGDPPDLPLGSDDSQILLWAEREGRILLTEDVHTISKYLNHHLELRPHSPGVLMVRIACSVGQLVGHLELIAHAGQPADYENSITFIP